jgi:GTP-binding protein HflX
MYNSYGDDKMEINQIQNERALLVGSYTNEDNDFAYSMEELKNLAESCKLEVVGEITQKIKAITAATFIGSGKVEEIRDYVQANEVVVVVMNDDLSPSQMRNVQEVIGCRLIDRTMLILDIFASRAKTKEAMLQVQVAQLKYLLPRINLLSANFNEKVGTRGPGETKYELDRRKIEKQIAIIEEELQAMVEIRQVQRRRRSKNEMPVVAIAGYTNSGKSTLLNTILDYSILENDKKVFAENMLFATLETTTRQIVLENNKKFLITDTVGFVSRLPHQLVKAFRSTLEEVTEADLILHVIDISNENHEIQKNVTEKVLIEIGVKDIPIINVYNKIDKFDSLTVGDGIYISASKKLNIDDLLNEISKQLFTNFQTVKLIIPYVEGQIFNHLKESANIISEKYENDGIHVLVELNDHLYNKFKHLIK